AAFVFLPAAEITITPRVETIGPVRLTVRADPAATAVDADTGVIPAQTVRIPVQSSGEFQATGKRVDETKATGSVTFDSINTVGPVSVPKGTRLSTIDGVVFVTDQSVIVPRAKVTGNRIEHGVASVGVSALNAGPAGNVDAGTITQAPTFMTTQQVSVTNPAPTTGGTRTETPKVSQQDVDGAVEQLRKDLDAQFATALQDPATVPAGTTLFPTTAALGDPTPSVDPATIVGQEVPSFSLAMSATGDVLAVDATPVKAIAEAKLQGSVSNGYGLVPGSITVSVGNGEVVDGVIRFTADGSARQVRQVDGAALKRQVLGLGADQARALLAPYGEVQLSLWPGWVSSVPTLDQRVTLTVSAPADETPSGSPPPAPSAAASQTPATTVPAGTGGSQPVPSG
ncbi:MAG: baseplate J/gp47 family protein, partial [Betaproteobacteria bacterium]